MTDPVAVDAGWLTVGRISVGRVREWSGRLFTRAQLLPTSTHEQWSANLDWLAPEFWDPATDDVLAALHTHVIRAEGRIILVDTGIGNGRRRPATPPLNDLDGPYLRRLERLGIRPDDVDTVVCTHLHSDHVGWNTCWDGERWRPTFPNARYLLPAADYRMLRDLRPDDDHLNYRDALADSIEPVVHAGRADFWEGDGVAIARGVRLAAAPGHSPGASVVWLEGDGATAVVSGDIVHHPMQIYFPHQPTAFDADPQLAVANRRHVLQMAVETDAVLLPAHFAGGRVPRLAESGDAYTVRDWVTIPH